MQSARAAVDYVAQDSSIPQPMKLAMIRQPALAMQYVAGLAKPPQFKYEKVGAGDNLFAVDPNRPGAQLIAQGGPDKPPPGYTWKQPSNPAAGLSPIPGGPQSKLPANEAGYLAMLKSSRPGVEQAKKYFLSPDFKSGPLDAAGLALGQKLDVGEISRQRRNIEMATEAALRIATGAAAPEPEVKRYANFYMPSVYDGEATRRQKLEALSRFMDCAKANMGRGRLPEPEVFMGVNSPTGPGLPGFDPTKPGAGWSAKRL